MAREVTSDMKRVHALVDKFGSDSVAGGMGLDKEHVFALMSGQAVWDEDVVARLDILCNSLSDVVDWSVGERAAFFVAGLPGGDVEEVGAGGFEVRQGYDHGDDEDPDDGAAGDSYPTSADSAREFTDMVRGTGVSVLAPGATAAEQFDLRLENLWAARDLAIMTQFAIGVDEREMLYALGVVNEIELALIMMFRQSVPERGRRWDEYRRQKEIYVRMVRKNRIQRDLKRQQSGWKGIVAKARGDKPMSARDMFDRLKVYVDDVQYVMDESNLSERLMDGMREFMGGG